MSETYRIGEFAELAGVTVRALHHYDCIGLLKPQRGSSGARLYCLKDLERLEQNVPGLIEPSLQLKQRKR